jgi:3-hydroxyisobutyrate dehydrogenase-like beta-hydroxyacid dehydrogenase
MTDRVGFLGLGIMGSRMAANLDSAGFELIVWNRTQRTAEEFCRAHPGVALGHTPAQVAADCYVVVTMVVDGPQVHEILLGEHAAAESARPGTLVIDCSTIGPTATREIAAGMAAHGTQMVDAPVTGSAPRAEDGTLTIMVGGETEDFERARPILAAMGSTIVHCGPLGHGQMVKLINNAVAATNLATVAQAFVLAARADVDLDALTQVMRAGSGASTMLEVKAGPMRAHDYTTLFKLDHMLKDVRLCIDEGQEVGGAFPFAALTREILTAARGLGYGDQDFAALVEPVEGAAGTKL